MHAILGYMIADLGVRLLPASLADLFAVWLARLVFAFRPRARRVLEANLGSLDPRFSAAERRRHAGHAFEHFALSLLDFLRLSFKDRAALARAVEVRGRPHLERALSSGRGVILLSVHLGNWEWGAAYLSEHGAQLNVVAREHPNRWVERFFRRRRRSRGVETLADRPVWKRAAQALRNGEWVALLGDRRAQGSSVPVAAWASALARRTGAMVLPGVMVRVAPGRYAACFAAPMTPEECSPGAYREAMRPYLRRYPGQWFAFEALPAGWA